MKHDLRFGDCLEVLRTLPDSSVDSIVTDPPYGLAFMGKRWDYDVPAVEIWAECLRVLKPGGHLLAFAGTRTQHRMACRIEDAGFEIRDMIAWVYGSGFPKSLDVSKAIDKAAGAEREVLGPGRWNHVKGSNDLQSDCLIRPGGQHEETAPATHEAQQWAGWGTALKPALEPITVARKPLVGTVAENVLTHGTGAINVDGCRVKTDDSLNGGAYAKNGTERIDEWGASNGFRRNQALEYVQPSGRWPANLIHDGSDEVLAAFPHTSSGTGAVKRASSADGHGNAGAAYGSESRAAGTPMVCHGDSGSAARFFYCAKASRSDRGDDNKHPTVKPTDLMRYLCRLVTPPGGVVLDPFMGSGSTGKAANLEGFRFIGVERDRDYILIAEARVGAKSDIPDWLR